MKSLRAKINEQLKKEGVDHICSYGLRWEKGERLQINDVCYARALYSKHTDRDDKKGEIKEIALSLKPASKGAKDKKAIRKWVDFIINRSIFKDVFLTKNVQAAWRYGVQVDVNKPTSQCVAGMIGLREGWEFPQLLKAFSFLTKNGINENVAFILSRMVSLENGNWQQSSWGGHQTISQINVENMRALLKEGMLIIDAPIKNNTTDYQIFNTMRSGYSAVGAPLSNILFKNPTGMKKMWGRDYPYLSNKSLISAAKQVEKELLA